MMYFYILKIEKLKDWKFGSLKGETIQFMH